MYLYKHRYACSPFLCVMILSDVHLYKVLEYIPYSNASSYYKHFPLSDFGIVLGCKLYVKELTLRAREQLNQGGQGLCEGDMVTRINNTPVTDAMTLKEARKLIESCKDRLNLVVTRELIREETVTNGNYQNNYNSLGK